MKHCPCFFEHSVVLKHMREDCGGAEEDDDEFDLLSNHLESDLKLLCNISHGEAPLDMTSAARALVSADMLDMPFHVNVLSEYLANEISHLKISDLCNVFGVPWKDYNKELYGWFYDWQTFFKRDGDEKKNCSSADHGALASLIPMSVLYSRQMFV